MNDGCDDPRVDPHIEVAILGGCLIGDTSAVALAEQYCTPEDFHHPAHAIIFTAILAVWRRGDGIDLVNVASELRRMGKFNTCGGAQYLGELTDATVTGAFVDVHARRLAELAATRRVRDLGRRIAMRANDPSVTLDALLGDLTRWTGEALALRPTRDVRAHREVLQDILQRIEDASTKNAGLALSTGFLGLDAVLAGLKQGNLTVLAARPAMGKTAMAECIVDYTARQGRRAAFFSEEMDALEVVNRRLAGEAILDARRTFAGGFSGEEFLRYSAITQRDRALPIHWHDSGRVSAEDIAAIARRLRHQHPDLALVVVDYVQRLRDIDPRREEEWNVGAASQCLKNLAKELQIPVLALAQLNRQCEQRADKRPTLADLRGSGKIEQEADVVMFLYRGHVYDPRADATLAEAIVAKHRGGPIGTVPLRFDGPRTRFTDDLNHLREYGLLRAASDPTEGFDVT